MYLLDTNVLSELMRHQPERRVTAWVDRRWGDCGLPTVAIFESRAGIAALPPGARRDGMLLSQERIVARFGPRVYALDRASAEMAAEVRAASIRQGRAMTAGDAMIAGIAAVYGLTLVTRNVRDFQATGIDLANPWDN